ncbi:hypothetical protein [Candidatus Cardinium hertigii]|nr:hypothetical protein [Candidatus Cardinium hertigii]
MINKNIQKGIAFLLFLSTIILAGNCNKKPKTTGSKTALKAAPTKPVPKPAAAAVGTTTSSSIKSSSTPPPLANNIQQQARADNISGQEPENVRKQWLKELDQGVADAHKALEKLRQELPQALAEGFECLCKQDKELLTWFQQQFQQEELENYIALNNEWERNIINIKQKQGELHSTDLNLYHDLASWRLRRLYDDLVNARRQLLQKLEGKQPELKEQCNQIQRQGSTMNDLLQKLYYLPKDHLKKKSDCLNRLNRAKVHLDINQRMLDKDERVNEEEFVCIIERCGWNLSTAKQGIEDLTNDLGNFKKRFLNKTISNGSK